MLFFSPYESPRTTDFNIFSPSVPQPLLKSPRQSAVNKFHSIINISPVNLTVIRPRSGRKERTRRRPRRKRAAHFADNSPDPLLLFQFKKTNKRVCSGKVLTTANKGFYEQQKLSIFKRKQCFDSRSRLQRAVERGGEPHRISLNTTNFGPR